MFSAGEGQLENRSIVSGLWFNVDGYVKILLSRCLSTSKKLTCKEKEMCLNLMRYVFSFNNLYNISYLTSTFKSKCSQLGICQPVAENLVDL